jgi:hypothetical protein
LSIIVDKLMTKNENYNDEMKSKIELENTIKMIKNLRKYSTAKVVKVQEIDEIIENIFEKKTEIKIENLEGDSETLEKKENTEKKEVKEKKLMRYDTLYKNFENKLIEQEKNYEKIIISKKYDVNNNYLPKPKYHSIIEQKEKYFYIK